MKTIFRYVLLLACVANIIACVPDMDINNPEEISEDTYYLTQEQLESALIPAYQQLFGICQGGYAVGAFNNMLAPGDDYDSSPQNTIYQDTYNTPSYDGTILNAWKDFYAGVYASNLAIEKISATDCVSGKVKDRMLGEAYFLRGIHYMHLCMLFGETIPLFDHSVKDAEEYYKGNSSSGEIYRLIVDDFTKASELLPLRSDMYQNPDCIGRATKGTAQGYLARTYLYRPILERGQSAEFEKAAVVLKQIIDSGEYALVDNFRANSMGGDYENNSESLFEVQMRLGADFFEQSYSLRWQMVGLPSGTGNAWWMLAPNQRSFDEFEEGDPRKYMTLWCPDGAHYTELTGNVADWEYMYEHLSTKANLYGTRKYCPDFQVGNIANENNERLLRYADVLLMYAECLHEFGKDDLPVSDPNGPKFWIQKVRDRANNIVPSEQPHLWYQNSPGTIPSVDELLASGTSINGLPMNSIKNIIVHERYVEFLGEYLRYFDLLRWGMADKRWLSTIESLGWTPKAMYYPFPQQELNNNKNLVGNDMN